MAFRSGLLRCPGLLCMGSLVTRCRSMSSTKDIINQAMALPPEERAIVVEQLLLSLDSPDQALGDLWAEEAEARLDAYERGEIATVSVQEAMAKYDKE